METSCLYSRSGDHQLQIWEYLLWSCLTEFLPVYVQFSMCQKEGTSVDVISLEDAHDLSSSSDYIWH